MSCGVCSMSGGVFGVWCMSGGVWGCLVCLVVSGSYLKHVWWCGSMSGIVWNMSFVGVCSMPGVWYMSGGVWSMFNGIVRCSVTPGVHM